MEWNRFIAFLRFGIGLFLFFASHSTALALAPAETIRVDGASGLFGASIEMSSDTIYVGDPGRNAVFKFQFTNRSWTAAGLIEAPEGVTGFGYALALDGDTLVIGAYARISTEEGSVYAYRRTDGLDLIATSDDSIIVGFAVAAEAGRIAYARRQRNDLEQQTGDVVIRTNGSETIYRSEAYPDYFGMRIDLDRDHLLAMAPAFGDRGGVFLFDLQRGSTLRLALPNEAGRASLEHPVALVGDACLMAGAGNAAHTQSVVWRGCVAGQAEIIDGTGEVSASSGRVAFSGNNVIPQFGLAFKPPADTAVFIRDLEQTEAKPVYVQDNRVENSIRRNVALYEDRLALAFIDASGVATIQIYTIN